MPALQTLRLNDTGLSRLNSLAAMRALRWLHLSDNALAGNVSWAAGMPALHSVSATFLWLLSVRAHACARVYICCRSCGLREMRIWSI